MTREILFASMALLFVAGPATAQSRHDSSAPIDVSSEHVELQDRTGKALLSGRVVIKQGELTLTAPRMTLSYTGQISEGSPEVSRLDASGGVVVSRPDQTARSQYAVYDLNRRVITMIGAVTLRQGANNVSGGRLSINLDTGRATIDGSGVSGGGTGATTGGVQSSGGRVTGRFSVPKRAGNTAPATTPSPTPKQ